MTLPISKWLVLVKGARRASTLVLRRYFLLRVSRCALLRSGSPGGKYAISDNSLQSTLLVDFGHEHMAQDFELSAIPAQIAVLEAFDCNSLRDGELFSSHENSNHGHVTVTCEWGWIDDGDEPMLDDLDSVYEILASHHVSTDKTMSCDKLAMYAETYQGLRVLIFANGIIRTTAYETI